MCRGVVEVGHGYYECSTMTALMVVVVVSKRAAVSRVVGEMEVPESPDRRNVTTKAVRKGVERKRAHEADGLWASG